MEMTQPGIGRVAFLDHLKNSDLLPKKQLERLVEDLPTALQTGTDVADRLIRSRVLTRFQAARLLVGRSDGLVVGQYVIQDYLGRGSVGRMYKARHRAMDRAVCVQILASEHTQEPASRAGLQAESRAAAQLVNSHIVTILDVNQVGPRMYLVTEFVDGASCETLVKASGPMQVKAAVEIVRQAALGLHYAHERGVAHGRLCADAVLVSRVTGESTNGKPIVKLAGFGLSQLPDSVEDLLTTFATRAPEQFANPTLREPKSDVYALGCVLYFLLTGRMPFKAKMAADLEQLHNKASVPNLVAERPTVPVTVANIVARMLAKEPAKRPTASEVAFYLEGALAQQDNGAVDLNTLPPSSGPLSFVGHQLSGMTAQPVVPLPDHAIIDQDVELIHDSQFDGQNTLRMTQRTPVSVKHAKPRPKKAPRKRRKKRGAPLAIFLFLLAVGVVSALLLFKVAKHFAG